MKILMVVSAMVIVLSSCGSTQLEVSECKSTNWEQKGLKDGASGVDVLEFNNYVAACETENVVPDKEAYYSGFQDGLVTYCTYDNGVELGKRSGKYYMACKDYKDFGTGYAKGVDIFIEERERREVEKLTRPTVEMGKAVAIPGPAR
ncbi:DUF2799 domain-containing protein [Paraglaciecola sp.]|uniref:DUF2799 domain-containing protein n=1 Tax=Paraglaciecola sp. TaxID=1920173 RepID=UPI003EF94764